MKNLTPYNCIGWMEFAYRYQLEDVSKKVHYLVRTQFGEVCKGAEFKSLSIDEVVSFLNNEDILAANRDVLLLAGINWIKYYTESRYHLSFDIFEIHVSKIKGLFFPCCEHPHTCRPNYYSRYKSLY